MGHGKEVCGNALLIKSYYENNLFHLFIIHLYPGIVCVHTLLENNFKQLVH